jgi:serine phosphatase RsbU (regulator of sigma subunit)
MRTVFPFKRSSPAPVCHPVHSDVPKVPGAELASVYYGRRMAGDFYDFIRVDPKRVLFGLFDAAGRLKETRVILTAAQHTFRAVGAELFTRSDINEADAMMQLCVRLNQTVLKAAERVCACPAFVGCYNEGLGVVWYFNAGHTPGLARDHNGISELASTGLPLGLFSHMIADTSMVALEPGAVLLLTSRGVVEGKYKSEEFGLQRVKDVLQQSKAENPKELCSAVLAQVHQFMCTVPRHDDVTTLALARNS